MYLKEILFHNKLTNQNKIDLLKIKIENVLKNLNKKNENNSFVL